MTSDFWNWSADDPSDHTYMEHDPNPYAVLEPRPTQPHQPMYTYPSQSGYPGGYYAPGSYDAPGAYEPPRIMSVWDEYYAGHQESQVVSRYNSHPASIYSHASAYGAPPEQPAELVDPAAAAADDDQGAPPAAPAPPPVSHISFSGAGYTANGVATRSGLLPIPSAVPGVADRFGSLFPPDNPPADLPADAPAYPTHGYGHPEGHGLYGGGTQPNGGPYLRRDERSQYSDQSHHHHHRRRRRR
ncbi:hypothetical protein Hte_010501 [Hypoxylon texense]